jgi:NADP-dependent 3-hydroxy acid dehydrogenase YdfG
MQASARRTVLITGASAGIGSVSTRAKLDDLRCRARLAYAA